MVLRDISYSLDFIVLNELHLELAELSFVLKQWVTAVRTGDLDGDP